jgi:uncharacterized phiE125 gp8 family phage protein
MMVNMKLNTAPAEEPITLAQAKLHLRVDIAPETSPATTNPDDLLIAGLITAARRWCELVQNRAYVSQIWDLYLDAFPAENYIELPIPPLLAVVALYYKDSAGAVQVVSFMDPSGTALVETDDFIVDLTHDPGRLVLKNGKAWPPALNEVQAVRVEFIAGYGTAADVPQIVKSAICLKLSDLYENRGDSEAGSNYEKAAKSLLNLERVFPI